MSAVLVAEHPITLYDWVKGRSRSSGDPYVTALAKNLDNSVCCAIDSIDQVKRHLMDAHGMSDDYSVFESLAHEWSVFERDQKTRLHTKRLRDELKDTKPAPAPQRSAVPSQGATRGGSSMIPAKGEAPRFGRARDGN